jgi:hypothetical protein
MNFFLNIDNVNGNGMETWQKNFRKYNFTQARFGELLGEVTQEVVLNWTSGTSIDTMIEDVILSIYVERMSLVFVSQANSIVCNLLCRDIRAIPLFNVAS